MNYCVSDVRVEQQFNAMCDFQRDYMDSICLKTEARETIRLFENEWNDFDYLTDQTKMLHTTKRRTQPWKYWSGPRGWQVAWE